MKQETKLIEVDGRVVPVTSHEINHEYSMARVKYTNNIELTGLITHEKLRAYMSSPLQTFPDFEKDKSLCFLCKKEDLQKLQQGKLTCKEFFNTLILSDNAQFMNALAEDYLLLYKEILPETNHNKHNKPKELHEKLGIFKDLEGNCVFFPTHIVIPNYQFWAIKGGLITGQGQPDTAPQFNVPKDSYGERQLKEFVANIQALQDKEQCFMESEEESGHGVLSAENRELFARGHVPDDDAEDYKSKCHQLFGPPQSRGFIAFRPENTENYAIGLKLASRVLESDYARGQQFSLDKVAELILIKLEGWDEKIRMDFTLLMPDLVKEVNTVMFAWKLEQELSEKTASNKSRLKV